MFIYSNNLQITQIVFPLGVIIACEYWLFIVVEQSCLMSELEYKPHWGNDYHNYQQFIDFR